MNNDPFSFRPRRSSDRGGIVLMPLLVNVPKGRPNWTLVICPKCGAKCWKAHDVDQLVREQGMIAMCTLCALKRGGYNAERKET